MFRVRFERPLALLSLDDLLALCGMCSLAIINHALTSLLSYCVPLELLVFDEAAAGSGDANGRKEIQMPVKKHNEQEQSMLQDNAGCSLIRTRREHARWQRWAGGLRSPSMMGGGGGGSTDGGGGSLSERGGGIGRSSR